MSGPRSLSRRDLLRLGGVTLAGGLAGCESFAGMDSQTTSTKTPTSDTGTPPSRTTTQPSRSALTPKPANVGPYTDWMVAREGASLFRFVYYPRYAWLLEQLPTREEWGQEVAEMAVEVGPEALQLLDPASVAEYFSGFTNAHELRYHLVQGDFDVEHIVSTATAPEGENSEADGFTATYNDIGAFDLYYRGATVFGITPETMLVVQSTYQDRGYYATMEDFRRVHDTIRGERTSFTATHEDYALLTEHLQRGHQIWGSPSTIDGTSLLGGQTNLVSPQYSLVDHVLVWNEQPSESEVRETVTASTLYQGYPIDKAGIEDIIIDGRAVLIKYPPIPNRRVYQRPGYAG